MESLYKTFGRMVKVLQEAADADSDACGRESDGRIRAANILSMLAHNPHFPDEPWKRCLAGYNSAIRLLHHNDPEVAERLDVRWHELVVQLPEDLDELKLDAKVLVEVEIGYQAEG
jgi:hypothetical protein